MNAPGFWLIDLLRRRRELPLAEVLRLGEGVPALLDSQGVGDGELIGRLFFRFPAEVEERVLTQPVAQWPDFIVELHAEVVEASEERTMVAVRPAQDGPIGPAALAGLLYELLGGVHRPVDSTRWSPLPAINEEGNGVLREALCGNAARESCSNFWQRWMRACGAPATARPWRIPRWLLGSVERGEVLQLVPSDAGGMPVSLIARDQFRIGRSRQLSDYPTRVYTSEGALDDSATVKLSRVQVLASCGPGGLTLRDGNGEKPSMNGSLWQGTPLPWNEPVPFDSSGTLRLGGTYELAVLTAAESTIESIPRIENLDEWHGSHEPVENRCPFSAVAFKPLGGRAVTRDAVWVGKGIGIRIDRANGFTWATGAALRPGAQFLFYHGAWWLANVAADGDTLHLNEAPLEGGQIAPLASGQVLEIGGRRFTLGVA